MSCLLVVMNFFQGPEWVWPVGYFLQAYLHFARLVGGAEKWAEAKKFVMSVMAAHYTEVQVSWPILIMKLIFVLATFSQLSAYLSSPPQVQAGSERRNESAEIG